MFSGGRGLPQHCVNTSQNSFSFTHAGGITGVMSTVVTNPIDVLKTRVQSAPLDADGRAAAVTLRGLVEKEGPAVLARGLGPRVVKIGLGQAIIFGVYDAVRSRLP